MQGKILRKSEKNDFYFVEVEGKLYPFKTFRDINKDNIEEIVEGSLVDIYKNIIIGEDEYGEKIVFNKKLLNYKEIRDNSSKQYGNLKFKVFEEK